MSGGVVKVAKSTVKRLGIRHLWKSMSSFASLLVGVEVKMIVALCWFVWRRWSDRNGLLAKRGDSCKSTLRGLTASQRWREPLLAYV